MYAITCDRCGDADVVNAPEQTSIVFAEQRARLCTRCHAALRAFLANEDAPTFAPVREERPLEPASNS